MMRNLFVIILVSLCVSCQSSPQKYYEELPVGSSKGRVLSELGSPHRSFRKSDVDHWIYHFTINNGKGPGQTVEREIQFRNGNVIRKGPIGEAKDSDFVPLD